MRRIVILLITLSVCLCSCLVKQEEEPEKSKVHVSEPIARLEYTAAFRKDDCELAKEFDRVLGEVIADGTAGKLCETHMNTDNVCYDPTPANIGEGDDDDDSLKKAREDGIIIGYHKQHEPMVWVDSANKAVGFDAELAYEIGRRLDIAIEFKIVEWHRIDSALANGEVDAVLSAFEYTEERAERFNLTRTYFSTSLVLISPEDEPIDSLSQLEDDARVGVSEGTYAERLLSPEEYTILYCPSNSNAYSRLNGNKCDVILVNSAFAEYMSDS